MSKNSKTPIAPVLALHLNTVASLRVKVAKAAQATAAARVALLKSQATLVAYRTAQAAA